ncbi:unnamed protein product, partial [Amoebophrya sp. A120]
AREKVFGAGVNTGRAPPGDCSTTFSSCTKASSCKTGGVPIPSTSTIKNPVEQENIKISARSHTGVSGKTKPIVRPKNDDLEWLHKVWILLVYPGRKDKKPTSQMKAAAVAKKNADHAVPERVEDSSKTKTEPKNKPTTTYTGCSPGIPKNYLLPPPLHLHRTTKSFGAILRVAKERLGKQHNFGRLHEEDAVMRTESLFSARPDKGKNKVVTKEKPEGVLAQGVLGTNTTERRTTRDEDQPH